MSENYYATLVIEPISPGPSDGASPSSYVGSLGDQESSIYYDGTYQSEIPATVQHTESNENQAYTPEASPVSDVNIDFSSTQTSQQNTVGNQIWNQTNEESSSVVISTAKNPSYEQLCSELLNDDNTWGGDYMEVTIKQEISPGSYDTSPISNEVFDIGFEGCKYPDDTQLVILPVSDQTTPVPKETPDSGFGECDDYVQQERSQVAEETYPLPSGIVDYNFDAYGGQNGSNDYNHQNLSSKGGNCDINRPILAEYQQINQKRNNQNLENYCVQTPATINDNVYSTITNSIGREPNTYQQFPVNYGRDYHHSYHTQHSVTMNRIPPYFGMQPQRSQNQNEINYKTVPENRSNATVDAKRFRTAFTDIQLKRLEEEFSKSQYSDRQKRIQLSMEINLTEKNIKIWYQNRRMKFKKEQMKQSDHVEIPTKPRRRTKCHRVGKYAVAKVADNAYASTNQVAPNMAFPSNRHNANSYYVPYYGPQTQQPLPFAAQNLSFRHMCNCPNMHCQMQISNHFGNYTNNVSSSNRFVNM